MKKLQAVITLLAIAAAADTASAQFLNRAVWLGRDEEGIRRDYEQGDDYFVNRAAIVDVPPWWAATPWDPFRNQFFVAGGSVSTDRLTLEGVGNVGVELGSGFTGRLNYLQSENQSTQFQRVAFGIDAALSEQTALFLQLEGTPDKSRSDLSLGVEFLRTEHSRNRVMFTLVDFAWRKSDELEYDEAPFGLSFTGFAGDPEGVELYYELGYQLPFTESRKSDDEQFQMARAIGILQGRLHLTERDRVILGLDGELTEKGLRPSDTTSADREDADVDHHRLSAEWWRSFDGGRELSIGLSYRQLREDNVRANDPANDLYVRRSETMFFGRGRLPFGEKWSAEPYLMGGPVQLETRRGEDTTSGDTDGFQGRLGFPIAFAFSDQARLRIDLALDLDALKFGGAAVQFLARF